MNIDWIVNLKVTHKKSRDRKLKAVIFDASVPCLSETVALTSITIINKAEELMIAFREMYEQKEKVEKQEIELLEI